MSASHTDLLSVLEDTLRSSTRPQNTRFKLLDSLAPDVQICYPLDLMVAPYSLPDLFDTTTLLPHEREIRTCHGQEMENPQADALVYLEPLDQ